MSQNSNDSISWLNHWREDLLRGSGKDPLVNLQRDSNKLLFLSENVESQFQLDLDAQLRKILAEQQDFFKTSGVNVLCIVHEILYWEDSNQTFQTPVFLSEVLYEIDKINKRVIFHISEDTFVNPFLEKSFQQRFDQDFSTWLVEQTLPESWSREKVQLLGNFHYHRFALLRDFDDYLNNLSVNHTPLDFFLQVKTHENVKIESLEASTIFPMDTDQQRVFHSISAGQNLVVQGPPGSGKSQVLSNLLFHSAASGKQVVLCSEKFTALQVVLDKLSQRLVGDFCSLVSGENLGKSNFVEGLKSTWMQLEKRATQTIDLRDETLFFKQKKDALALKLERLASFPKLTSRPIKPRFELSIYPDWSQFQTYKDELFRLHENSIALTHKPLNQSAFFLLQTFVFKDDLSLQNVLSQVPNQLRNLEKMQLEFGESIACHTTKDLEKLHRVAIHAQLLSQNLFRQNEALFDLNSPTAKKFNKLRQRYFVSKQTVELYQTQEGFKWEKPWSHEELNEAKTCFTTKNIWNSSFRNWKKKFIQAYQPEVFTKELAIKAIESCLSVHEVMQDLQKCQEEFAKMGLTHLEVDLPLVNQLQSKIAQDTLGIAQTRAEFSQDNLLQILNCQSEIQEVYRFVNHYLKIQDDAKLVELFTSILSEQSFLMGQRELILRLLEVEPLLPKFLPQIIDFNALDEVILWGSIEHFKNRNPALYHHRAEDLMFDIEQLIQEEDAFFDQQIEQFWNKRTHRFVAYHELIGSNSSKLTQEQKEFRKKLKSGRTLLIKEFNKSRQHKSMYDLMSSDAAPWIELLKPILLLNPTMVSTVLPNLPNSIDLLLFDEASQIPFAHAIPALFRAKQIAVFGDSQQLSPSAFFLQGAAQISDVLSEAQHFLHTDALQYHYRSRHEALISFSNRFFYKNELKVLPAKMNPESDGVFCHFVEHAVYDSGHNKTEAQVLVNQLVSLWKSLPVKDKIGIVSFSEKQLETTGKELFKQSSEDWVHHLESGRLTLTTLEKVQGDEFDVLLISMGYARDIEGNFALRFGPVNQEGGEKRLNVLFSRARRALHFFHSVKSHDFGHSENLGVQTLKNFLLMHEDNKSNDVSTGIAISKDEHEIWDAFYNPNAVDDLMILKRHTALSGLKLRLRFWKDA